MSDRLRVALAGCGRLAELGYAPAIRSLDAIELVAVADPVAARAEAVAAIAAGGERRRAATHDSLERLLDADLPDAVIVATPTWDHVRSAELAAAAGVGALVEKPPARDATEAMRLAALRPAPWLGFNRRFVHGERLLGRVPGAGPLELELELDYRRVSWRAHEVADGALLDIAPHLVDLALLLTGATEVELVAAHADRDWAELELALDRARATIRCATDRPHRERVAVRRPGERPLAVSELGGLRRGVIDRLRRVEHPLVASLRAQLTTLRAALGGAGAGLLASAEDGVRAMEVIDAARRRAGGAPGQAAPARAVRA